jgi:hypothetical protein
LLVTGKSKTKTVEEFRNKNNSKTAGRNCSLTTAKHMENNFNLQKIQKNIITIDKSFTNLLLMQLL